jgi:hypothetical protein
MPLFSLFYRSVAITARGFARGRRDAAQRWLLVKAVTTDNDTQ